MTTPTQPRSATARHTPTGCPITDAASEQIAALTAERDALLAQSEINSLIIGKAHSELIALRAALEPAENHLRFIAGTFDENTAAHVVTLERANQARAALAKARAQE